MDDLFRPPTARWRQPAPAFLRLRLVSVALGWLVFAVIVGVPMFIFFREQPWWWVPPAAAVAIMVYRLLRSPAWFRRWGYAETATDVYLTQGLWFRELSCVPYGRMQLVTVSAGPIERMFGLSSVQLVTSSTSGTITIPGLSAQDAAALRDRLIERGELLQAGI